ncbi:recombinase family protein [Bradyrhizobium erythrophlei]|uniref:recombinase family protein n=1 Tax=Bradyrhizobium erythrophlei TaxID=1437360 RepID=UPI0035EABE08
MPGPRGGVWNASTIAGSRKRLNGILQNELYVGRIIWNRQSFFRESLRHGAGLAARKGEHAGTVRSSPRQL